MKTYDRSALYFVKERCKWRGVVHGEASTEECTDVVVRCLEIGAFVVGVWVTQYDGAPAEVGAVCGVVGLEVEIGRANEAHADKACSGRWLWQSVGQHGGAVPS